MKKEKLSIVVIAKNEEEMIKDCLKSATRLADEIIFIDTGSTDKTADIARRYNVRFFSMPSNKLAYAKWRNFGLKKTTGEWVFYLDADERITPALAKEVRYVVSDKRYSAYAVPRRNFLLGKELHWGGWWPDYVKRLFKKDTLKKWEGRLHEEPIFEGKLGHLKEPLIHFTHRDLSSMVEKTREWSKIEAELLYSAGHPPVTWWRIIRIMLGEFGKRAVRLQGWRDGTIGWIEIIFQMFSRFITYARLWEKQKS